MSGFLKMIRIELNTNEIIQQIGTDASITYLLNDKINLFN